MFVSAAPKKRDSFRLLHSDASPVKTVRRIELLTVLAATLTGGLGMIIVLVRIIPLSANALLPFGLTVAAMLVAGLVTLALLALIARRNA